MGQRAGRDDQPSALFVRYIRCCNVDTNVVLEALKWTLNTSE